MTSLWEMFFAGGFIMYPLAICSLLSWGIALQRIWWLLRTQKDSRSLSEAVFSSIEKGNREELVESCLRSRAPVARILEELLKSSANGEQLQQRAQRRRIELQQEYKSFLWILGTIGSATPFLGLFGTVVGILRAFKQMAVSGETGFAVVASGISEALIATAAGIIVAVIAVAFYNFLQVRVSRLATESRLLVDEVLDFWLAKR